MCWRWGNGCLIGAVLIVLVHGIVGIALADSPGSAISRNPYEQTRDNPSRADPPRAPSPASQQPERRTYTADYERACDQPKTAEEADLCQQWRMAKASEKLVEIADRQFWATVAEITALVFVLVFTALATIAASRSAKSANHSAIATNKAADAALEANRINRDILALEHRAWLKIIKVEIMSPISWVKKETQTGEVRCRIIAKNISNTPAIDVEVYTDLRPVHVYLANRPQILRRAAMEAQGLHREHEGFYTITVFPGDIIVREWICSFMDTDLKRAGEIADPDWYKDIIIHPVLIACVNYRLAFAAQHHQTWEVYSIRRKTVGEKSGYLAIIPIDGDIPVDELEMGRVPVGGTFTN